MSQLLGNVTYNDKSCSITLTVSPELYLELKQIITNSQNEKGQDLMVVMRVSRILLETLNKHKKENKENA